jgi:hypothetical protein
MYSLRVLVKHYENNFEQKLNNELVFYKQFLTNPAKLINLIAWAITADGTTHKHQRRIRKKVKAAIEQHLLKNYKSILSYKNFDDFMKLVGNIVGIGQLTAFDIAKRLGNCFGILPKKIYIHRGAYEGAKNLLGNKVKGRKFLYMHELPSEHQKLSPIHVENFLCIYKDHLTKSIIINPLKSCFGKVPSPNVAC